MLSFTSLICTLPSYKSLIPVKPEPASFIIHQDSEGSKPHHLPKIKSSNTFTVGAYTAMFCCNVWPRKTFPPLAFGTIVEALGITILAAALSWGYVLMWAKG